MKDCLKSKDKVCEIWKPLNGLDAQIRKVYKPTKDNPDFMVDIGLFESLGERGGDVLTEFFKEMPSDKDIRDVVVSNLKELKGDFSDNDTLSGREEMQLKALKKIRLN